jgi:hypothetical protein
MKLERELRHKSEDISEDVLSIAREIAANTRAIEGSGEGLGGHPRPPP